MHWILLMVGLLNLAGLLALWNGQQRLSRMVAKVKR